ncbi:MAG: GntR family transcriptional regulator [Clostridia bacterium]|nr:GntR family transcriptional regulator [Clostridia bacterium]
MAWQFNNTEAVFLQIADRLRHDILNGKYQPDQQIPPVRQLASIAAVNPNTMQKALTCLEDEGLLHSQGTVGRFVTSDTAVLDAAREKMRRDTVRGWLKQAKELGISTEELIKYIEEVTQQ